MKARLLAIACLTLGACGREVPPWLRGAWAIGTFHARVGAGPPEASSFVGQYEFTTAGEFLVRYEYCDDTPTLTGRNQWFAPDETQILIGPIAPQTRLDFPILSLSGATAVPGEDEDDVDIELFADEGPGGLLRLSPGARCFAGPCGTAPVPCP